jgi:hypothetical protein
VRRAGPAIDRSAIAITLSLFALQLGILSLRFDLNDTAIFGGDTWAYQSVAVNLARGHGYKLGEIEDFSAYRFRPDDYYVGGPPHAELRRRFREEVAYWFYSAPGYPLFLAGTYALFGVEPLVAKILQALILAGSAALLPLLARRTWGERAWAGGIAASLLFTLFFCPDPTLLMGETLAVAMLTLWAFAFVRWEARAGSARRVGELGLATGISLLVKPFAPLPLLVALVVGARTRSAALPALFLLACAAPVLPWSAFASHHSESLVLLSTQSQTTLLDGNNEFSIRSGRFQPDWRKRYEGRPYFLYNRPSMAGRGTLSKVAAFWRIHLDELPIAVARKLRAGLFSSAGFTAAMIGFLAFYTVAGVQWLRSAPGIAPAAFPLILFLTLVAKTVVLFGTPRHLGIFLPFFLLAACQLPLLLWRIAKRDVRD